MSFMDWVRKVQDVIMPVEPLPEEEEVSEKQQTEVKAEQVQQQPQMQTQNQAQNLMETMAARRTASASGGFTASVASNVSSYAQYKESNSRPNLKFIKAPEFVMKVYTPADYSPINGIADDILAQKAAIVNYEYVHAEEQRRICDYIDGVCYAIDGHVTKISEKIFLYTPSGINTGDIAALVASVRYH